MKCYYFSESNKKLRFGDNRVIAEGVTHEITGEPVLCVHGLHASIRAIDALKYAPGTWLWIVELSGKIIEGEDKCVAQKRTYLKGVDASSVLREFARHCAMLNIELIKPYCSEDNYNIIIEFLKTGENAEAAESAYYAVSAAYYESVAYYAAESAARAAYYAAYVANAANAVYYAARAAEDAAYYARAAARAAEEAAIITMDELNQIFEKMIEEKINLK